MIFFKKKFQQLREAQGLTLDDIAAACGCSKQTVQKWEKHATLKPRPTKIPQLAKILHCAESDIAQYGPLEKTLDAVNEEDQHLKKMDKQAKKQLTDLILRYMELHALDQKEMAARLNVQPSTLCAWLNPNGHGITRKHVERIKFVCGDAANVANVAGDGDSVERFRNGLIGALIDSDLSPEALQIALKIVKNYSSRD